MTAASVPALRAALACLLLLGTAPLLAQPSAPLPAWDQLTPAQREALIAPIRERWNAEPAQRPRMLAHAERWASMSPEQRQHARRGVHRWQQMDPAERERMRAVFAHLRALPDAERRAFMARWRAMGEEEKRAWIQAHPAPAREPRGR